MRQTLRRDVRRAVSPVVGGLVGGLVMAALLGGCGGGDGDATPTFSPSTTPTAASTTASPVSPSTSATEVQETPEAFIKRWAALDAQMQNSGQTAAYLALSQGCQACQKTADTVNRYYGDGGYVHFEGHDIVSVVHVRPATAPVYVVTDVSGPTQYKTSTSAAPQSFPGGRVRYQFTLKRNGASWLITDYVQLAS